MGYYYYEEPFSLKAVIVIGLIGLLAFIGFQLDKVFTAYPIIGLLLGLAVIALHIYILYRIVRFVVVRISRYLKRKKQPQYRR